MITIKELYNTHVESVAQSLFRADNILPSENLKKHGRTFGFSSYEFAKAWAKSHNYEHIYQFSTDRWILDDKQYMRKSNGEDVISDNEYIALNVLHEEMIE